MRADRRERRLIAQVCEALHPDAAERMREVAEAMVAAGFDDHGNMALAARLLARRKRRMAVALITMRSAQFTTGMMRLSECASTALVGERLRASAPAAELAAALDDDADPAVIDDYLIHYAVPRA